MLEQCRDKFNVYCQLMRLDRPIGIFLLLWPTLMALWIAAEGVPDLVVLTIFTMGVVIMRSAGCVINDYADRNVDGLVLRTMNRPLATGTVSSRKALIVFASLGLLALLLVLLLNTLTIYLSVIGLLLAVIYPFMKRYTYLPQIFLGMAFGWAIPMAFAAQLGTVPAVAWLLFLANIIWATIYDTFYAMVDSDDDLLAGIKSTAILFGDDDKVIIGILQLLFIAIMILIGGQLELSFSFYFAVIVVACLFFYQQKLISNRERAQCLHAFLNNNWVGAALFFGIVVHYGLN
ncbi:MAG: 4-hydroxybenzoate octaprenyltransferase [Gammaproteobacteria bacterium]|nr:4-hydroxybenzoate octaprenyltransferase [Gammaproteobacteria bacterium]